MGVVCLFFFILFFKVNSQNYTYTGDNMYAQSIIGPANTPAFYSVMTNINNLYGKDVLYMASGWYHTLFITSPSNSTYSVGYNSNGQLGDGLLASRNVPYLLPHTTTQVAGGGISSMYLTTNGDVYSFGSGQFGTLCKFIILTKKVLETQTITVLHKRFP